MKRIITGITAITAALVFFWAVILKLLVRAGRLFNLTGPCPASLAWVVDNPVRRFYTRDLMDRIGIKPGEHVLELGPGPGAFTMKAAGKAGEGGLLTAVDIQPEMIEKLNEKIKKGGVENVRTHVASAYDLPLADACVDRVFLVTVLTEIPDQGRALDEIRRVLKPGGVLSVTEEFLDPDYPFASETVRMVTRQGFRVVNKSGNFWVYTVNFTK